MTITGDSKKTKGRKRHGAKASAAKVDKAATSGPDQDPMKALRALIEEEMLRQEAKAAAQTAKKPAAPPRAQSRPPEKAKAKKAAQQDNARNAKPAISATPPPPLPPPKASSGRAGTVSPPSLPSSPPSSPSSKEVIKPMSQPQQQPPIPTPPSLAEIADMTAHIVSIAQRSHKVLASFMSRNKTLAEKIPSPNPSQLGKTFAEFMKQTLSRPEVLVEKNLAFWQDYVRLLQNTMKRMAGEQTEGVIAPEASDKRFKDAAWQEVWLFDFIKQSYLLVSRLMDETISHAEKGLDPKLAHKLRFFSQQMIDAMAPSNFWMTNPEVLRTTMESHGENLVKGLEHMLNDFERGHGQLLISMSDSSVFHFGENIATTKGKVVYQNDLIQLIQFSPLTETVHKTPYLIVPPWINKYYILDLKAENSFIRYLVEQGHTVFCVSWVNPDQRHSKLSFEDYMSIGPVSAIREIKKITGEDNVNCLGYCIGGTLVACMLGWLAGLNEKPADLPNISSVTYLVALVDFSQPGDLGVFIDEESISMIEALMEGQGYLPASFLGTTFSMLRANDLVWSFVVNNYLMGKDPFPFDLLTWNSDSTNLPAAMQSFYLRNMYLNNKLVQPNALTMKDVPIDLRKVKVPAFILGTQEDHITLWRGVYAGTQIYSGPTTFCLAGSGHIAGVVNPPAKGKYGYWLNDNCPPNPDNWLKTATQHKGSWWPEWIKWLDQHSGPMIPAADRDPAKNPNAIEDAPGSFVKVRVM